MKRYVTGVLTGTLVGAVVAGVWLLRRPRSRIYRGAQWLGPTAYKVARHGGHRLVHMAKRRLG